MKCLFITAFLWLAGVANAESGEILKNLSVHPVRFDVAFDSELHGSGSATTLSLFSSPDEIRATVSCQVAPTAAFARYIDIDIYNRWGTHMAEAFKYMSYEECQNLITELFDNPKKFEFSFGPLNYWNYRPATIKKDVDPQ